jgi:hypothetical protein
VRAGARPRRRAAAAASRVPVTLALALLASLATSVAAQSEQDSSAVTQQRPERPAWVVEGVPDTVWVLIERAADQEEDDHAKKLLREAEALARESLNDHEQSVGRRFALAAALGMRADREGGGRKVRTASALYEELESILELDPEHARARHMMGRLHAGVRRMNRVTRWVATNLMGGDVLGKASWEEAERHLVFAEERAPEVPDHHLQLARLYAHTDRPARAAEEVEHVLAMEPDSPMERAAVEEARQLQEELSNR